MPILIYVDADACPVKPEVYRVAERHGTVGELRTELATGTAAPEHTELAAWLRG